MHFSPPQKLMLLGGAMFVLPAAIDNGGEVCSWSMIAGIVLYVGAVAWMGAAWAWNLACEAFTIASLRSRSADE